MGLAEAFDDGGLGLRRGVVEVARADARWARVFADVHHVLAAGAPDPVVAIEHIGSTAVPGLDAKPILDVGIGVSSDAGDESIDRWLTGLGMLFRGDADDVRPDRMYGYEREPMIRLMNVHVLPVASPGWHHYLAFRDHLRANDSDRDAYAALKHGLRVQHPGDRLAYIAGKEPFILPRR